MDQLAFPPSTPAIDETAVSDHTGFENCERALQGIASLGWATLTDRQYYVSPKWGNVLRGKFALKGEASAPAPIVCWSKPGEPAEFMIDMSSSAK